MKTKILQIKEITLEEPYTWKDRIAGWLVSAFWTWILIKFLRGG